jgi:DNA-binding transcriptional LysR family regulator
LTQFSATLDIKGAAKKMGRLESGILDNSFGGEREGGDIFRPGSGANIPTDFLRTFVTICELGSFTKAAHRFGLTQPAVSAQIRKLELMIGGGLLERKSPGIGLTDRGSEVLKFARRMLSINDQILAFSGARTSTPVIRVGIPNIFAIDILQKLAANRTIRAANSCLQICCDSSNNLLQRVRENYLDIACVIGDEPEIADASVSWLEEFVWVRAPDAMLDGRAEVPLIGSPHRGLSDRVAIEALTRANRRCEITFFAYDRIARHAAAAAGLGYLTMPRRVVPHDLAIEDPGRAGCRVFAQSKQGLLCEMALIRVSCARSLPPWRLLFIGNEPLRPAKLHTAPRRKHFSPGATR